MPAASAFVWHSSGALVPVPSVNRVEMNLLKGIDRVRDQLLENTERFAAGLPANNALLWGARGMGKSSLVKACHNDVCAGGAALKLVEIHRERREEWGERRRGPPWRRHPFGSGSPPRTWPDRIE